MTPRMFRMLEQERASLNKEQQKEQTDKVVPGMSGTLTFVFSTRCHDSMFPLAMWKAYRSCIVDYPK